MVVIWTTLIIGMLFRIIPNKWISMGARKHYACSFKPNPESHEINTAETRKLFNKGAILSALSFITINLALFFILINNALLTPASVILISLFYAIIDIVFILFFCPFRALFLRNRCCTVCRIYNWDYIMICFPFMLYWHFYSLSLLFTSVIVLICWETAIKKKFHYFNPSANANLNCALCKDRLCFIKKNSNK